MSDFHDEPPWHPVAMILQCLGVSALFILGCFVVSIVYHAIVG
jgi:hypothetical protein